MATAIQKITVSPSRDIHFNELVLTQGAKLIDKYDSSVAFGHSRVLLVWTRIIMPDDSSIGLERCNVGALMRHPPFDYSRSRRIS